MCILVLRHYNYMSYPRAVYCEGPEIFNSHATLQDGRSMEAAILWIGGGPGRREVPDDVLGCRNGILNSLLL